MNEVIFSDGKNYYKRSTGLSQAGIINILIKNNVAFVAYRNVDASTSMMEPTFKSVNDLNNRKIDVSYIKNNYEPEQVYEKYRSSIYATNEKNTFEKELDELEQKKNKLSGEILTLKSENKKIQRKKEDIQSVIHENELKIESINKTYEIEVEEISKEKQAFLDSLTPEEREIFENL